MAGRERSIVFRACVATGALTAGLLAQPTVAHAEEPLAPAADTNPSTAPPPSARPNLVLIGAAVTAGWYGAAVGTSYLWPDSDGASALRIPVAGPYMALAKTGCSSRESLVDSCGTFTVVLRTILTSLSAVGQTGGVLAMLEGVFVPTSTAARSASRASAARKVRGPHIAVAPVPAGASGVNGLGFGVFGEF
ncbi:MAG TPA: hypothetical protein VF395_00575 [Polyangiaceae bacterium]